MTRPHTLTSRPALLAALVTAVLLALLAIASAATAKGAPHFHRGHLPAIGEIKLVKTKGGRAEVTVPITYTQALSPGHPKGLESSEVTLAIARKIKAGHATGVTFTRIHRHTLLGTGTVLDRFRLKPKTAHWLFGRSAKERGRLVRVDVRHRIKTRRSAPPLHEKASSVTMASSHQAMPQGESAFLVVKNDTDEEIKTAAEPDLCMYSEGEFRSNLQLLTTQPGRPLQPGGTIEAAVEGSASIFDKAVYEGGKGSGAGGWFDWSGVAVSVILEAAEFELAPFIDAIDIADHCESQASIFQIIASDDSGEATSKQAWVVTSETCSRGCVDTNLPTAWEALGVQHLGPSELGPGEWAENSTDVLQALVGGWREPPAGAKVVQDQGLHWTRKSLPPEHETWVEPDGEGFNEEEETRRAWELSIGEGSSPAGFSG
jgi:hypothetical protein